MSELYQFVSGDTGSKLQVTCKNESDESIIDITGSIVKLKWKDSGGVLITKTTTVTSATGGMAEYQFGSSELFAGTMAFEVEITDTSSNIISSLVMPDKRVRTKLS